ncbi:MAG: hypothetical protein ACRDNZ_02685 [Streptosporangiaceae bacterium]
MTADVFTVPAISRDNRDMTAPQPDQPTSPQAQASQRRQWDVPPGIAVVVAAALTVLGVFVGKYAIGASGDSGTARHTQSAGVSYLAINPPGTATIPRCATVTGAVSAPRNYSVWLAQAGYGESGYFNPTLAQRSGNQWRVVMTVGSADDRGRKFSVYAFVLDDEATSILSNVKAKPGNAYVFLPTLPSGISLKARPMTRNQRNVTAC